MKQAGEAATDTLSDARLARGPAAGTARFGPLASARLSTTISIGSSAIALLALLGPFGELVGHVTPHSVSVALHQPGAFDPLLTSLAASAVALAVVVALGLPLAWMLARDRLPAPRLWRTGLLIPLLMPPLVLGLLLIYLYGPRSPLGELIAHVHLSATNTFLALVIAEVYEAAPYFVLGAQSAFADVDIHLEQAAALLGHRPVAVFRTITLPLSSPGLATALAFAWARAIGAFGAVIIVAYNPHNLPVQIWLALQDLGLGEALPFALLLVVVALPFPLAAYSWAARGRPSVAMATAIPVPAR